MQCWGSYSKKVISYLLLVTSLNCNEITLLVTAFETSLLITSLSRFLIYCRPRYMDKHHSPIIT